MWPKRKYPDPLPNHGGVLFEVDQWIVSEFVVKMLLPVVTYRPFPLVEQCLMVSAVLHIQPDVIFEWGTHKGKSARIFYETVKGFGLETKIHSTDLPDDVEHVEHPGKIRGKLVKGFDEVSLHQGDGMDVSLKLLKKYGKGVTSLFFLDGDHEYDSVKRELNGINNADAKANILVHDTLNQTKESGYNTGPYRAVEWFLKQYGSDYDLFEAGLGLPGMSLLLSKG